MTFKYDKIKLGALVIIVGLMLVLFAFESGLEKRLKLSVLAQNNITSLNSFKDSEGKFSYKLPSEWKTKTQQFPGNEIIYHNDFISSDSKIHGFVQIWKNTNLKDFIEKSKTAAFKKDTFYGYNISKTKINNKDAYVVKYSMKSQDYGEYAANEYYVDGNGEFIRIAFYVRKINYNTNMDAIFDAISKTIIVN